MPPVLALFLTLTFIAFLFWRDSRDGHDYSSALWLPFLWIAISSSRFLSEWLSIIGIGAGGVTVEEGSPLDAAFFFTIIAAGVFVLANRRVSWETFARQNGWVVIYLMYCLVSVTWSDYPFVALKRWFKLFGQPVMVLIVLTEPDPFRALTKIMKRCAFLLLPLSILFIKYFPDLGRGYDVWSGAVSYTGVTTNKNSLGILCLAIGFVLFWSFIQAFRNRDSPEWPHHRFSAVIIAPMLCWLLYMANSKTSLVTLLLGISILAFLGFSWVNRSRVGTYLFLGPTLYTLADIAFDISAMVFKALGRDETFTGRTEIWRALWETNAHPIIGYGFESFWLGDRRVLFSRSYTSEINQAHNGYLETYMQLGAVGVIIIVALIVASFFKGRRDLLTSFEIGRFRIAYLAAFLVFNWTEAAFRTHYVHFFLFFFIAIDYRSHQQALLNNVPTVADEDRSENVLGTSA